MFEELFARKKVIPENLLQYGFEQADGKFKFTTTVLHGEFILCVTVDADGTISTRLTDSEGNEYVLYKTNAVGGYVGEVREAVAEILQDIALRCCIPAVFTQEQTLRVIDFVSKNYDDELEFLWEKFPDNAVWRRKDTKKWYGAILTVQKNKLGLDSAEKAEIIDLRAAPQEMQKLLGQQGYYAGWHMNKKSWFTIILDDSIGDTELYELIRRSYALAVK